MTMQQKIELARPGVGADRVVYVDGRTVAWVQSWPSAFAQSHMAASAQACAGLIIQATPPLCCGEAIPVAPARGPMLAFTPRRMEPTKGGRFVSRHDGFEGRSAARVADVFDLMEKQARNRHAALVRKAEAGGEEPPRFVPPFSVGQVEIARQYAALTERCAASGVKCSSLEALRNQGQGGDREAAVFRDFEQLRVFHRRIGNGLVKEVRRIRPGGRKRQAIYARYLVDQVCLGGRSLGEVLEVCGWQSNGKSRDALRRGLCASLDRMRGFDLQKGD